MRGARFRYVACGLEVDSEFAVSHLPAGNPGRSPDVLLRSVSGIEPFAPTISTPQWRLGPGRVHLLDLGGSGECLCSTGTEISLLGATVPQDETCTILGRALAVICFQRGLPVLHAAVVERAGRAVAIAGRSGAGKSTLAMELSRHGYRIVADDIAACDVTDDGVVAHPLYPVTRRRATGPAPPGWKPLPGTEKQVSTNVPFCPEARALDRVFVVEVSGGGPLRVRDLSTREAAVRLEAISYRKGLARALLGYEGLKRIAASAASHLRVSVVTRPPACPPALLTATILRQLERS